MHSSAWPSTSIFPEQDEPGAIDWWRRAALQGHVESMYRLGNALSRKKAAGVEARKWLESAALAGHAKAARAMSNVLTDRVEERAWLLVWKKTRKALGRPLTRDEQYYLDSWARWREKGGARANQRAQKLWKQMKPAIAARQLEIGARTGKRP